MTTTTTEATTERDLAELIAEDRQNDHPLNENNPFYEQVLLEREAKRCASRNSSKAACGLDASAEEQHELKELSTGFVDVAVTFSGIWKQPGFSNKDRDALVERLATKVRALVEDEIDGEFTRLERTSWDETTK